MYAPIEDCHTVRFTSQNHAPWNEFCCKVGMYLSPRQEKIAVLEGFPRNLYDNGEVVPWREAVKTLSQNASCIILNFKGGGFHQDALVESILFARNKGVKVALCGIDSPTKDMLHITRLDQICTITSNLAEAKRWCEITRERADTALSTEISSALLDAFSEQAEEYRKPREYNLLRTQELPDITGIVRKITPDTALVALERENGSLTEDGRSLHRLAEVLKSASIDAKNLLVDLSGIHSTQGGTIGPFLGILGALRPLGGAVVLINPCPSLQNAMGLGHVNRLLPQASSIEEALEIVDQAA